MSPIQKLTISALLTLVVAPATCAQTPLGRQSFPVRYGDLNLASREGAHTMLQRLDHAARVVCGDTPSPAELLYSRHYAQCKEAAIANAVAEVDSPLVAKQLADRNTSMLALR